METQRWILSGLFALIALSLSAVPTIAQTLPPEVIAYPDLVVWNGKVLTADERNTTAQAVAIRDGKFLAVGTNERIRALIGPETQVIDAQGKSVVPGFVNSHHHLADYTARPLYWWREPKEALETVKGAAATTPEGQWIALYYSPSVSNRLEGKFRIEDVDAITTRHPVLIGGQVGGSIDVLNSLALQKFIDFQGGSREGIVTDPQSGKPTGRVRGPGVENFTLEVVEWMDPLPEKVAGLKAAIQEELSRGFTTLHTRVNPHGISSLRELWINGDLHQRWRIAFSAFRGEEPVILPRLGNLTGIGDDMLRISGIAPGSLGGNIGTGTGAWTFEPKVGLLPGERDLPYGNTTAENWRNSPTRTTLVEAVKWGWSVVGMHVEGDQATAAALATYEEAFANRMVKSRNVVFRMDHLPLLRNEEIQKMKELGVAPSIAPWHPFARPLNTVEMYGIERVSQMAPARRLLDAGLKLVTETSFVCPMWNAQFVITRKTGGDSPQAGPERIYGPSERVTREEALKMLTINGAHYVNEADRLGSIEVGKLGDLLILDGDYMAVPEDQIVNLGVQKTIVGGKIVYETSTPGPCKNSRFEMTRELGTYEGLY